MSAHDTLGRSELLTLRGARRLHGAYVALAISPLPLSPKSKFACVVSKKVSAKASVRNTVKRRCREAIRPLMRNTPAVAIVCTAKRESASASLAEIRADITSLLGA